MQMNRKKSTYRENGGPGGGGGGERKKKSDGNSGDFFSMHIIKLEVIPLSRISIQKLREFFFRKFL